MLRYFCGFETIKTGTSYLKVKQKTERIWNSTKNVVLTNRNEGK